MTYNGYKESIKKANKKYMDKLERIYIWCTPEEKKIIEQRSRESGKSINSYCKDILLEKYNGSAETD